MNGGERFDPDPHFLDWRANAREAIENAAQWRKDASRLPLTPRQRVNAGLRRLMKWADERARS